MAAKRKTTTTASKAKPAQSPQKAGADFADQIARMGRAFTLFMDGMNERSAKIQMEARKARLEEAYARLPTDEKKAEWDRDMILALLKDRKLPFKKLFEACRHNGASVLRFSVAYSALVNSGKIKVGSPPEELVGIFVPAAKPAEPEAEPVEEQGAPAETVEGRAPEFAAAYEPVKPTPPKLPEVNIPLSVDVILGVDADLRNAVFQMRAGDDDDVRRCIQSAIAKIQPAFEECGKALTKKVTVTPEMLPPKIVPPEAFEIPAYEFANLLGVSRDRVDRWMQQGMPHARNKLRLGGPAMIPLLAACAWLHGRLVPEVPQGSEVSWQPDPGTRRRL